MLHRALAVAARRAERVASFVEAKAGEHFTRTRRRIRHALIEDGIAGEIEALVARLFGAPGAATLSAQERRTMRTDIFGLNPRQQDMSDAPGETFDPPMGIDDMRRELREALDQLRAADRLPWPPQRLTAHRVMFEDMAGRIGGDEGRALVAAFQQELRRLRVIVD